MSLTVISNTIAAAGGSVIVNPLTGAIAITPKAGQSLTLSGLVATSAALTTPTVTGVLTLATAASQVVPGATSLDFRNHAGSASNLKILDSGQVSIGGGTSSLTTNLMTYDSTVLPDNATILTSVNIVGANSGATNRTDNGIRSLNVVNTWTGANGTGTFSTIYGTAIHGGSGQHVHMFGTLGFAQFTSTGGAQVAAGVWGGFNLQSAAGSAVSGPIVIGAGVYADSPTWFAGAVVTTYASVYATGATNAATSTVTNNLGVFVSAMPAGASGTNALAWLGPILPGVINNLGLGVAQGGAWIKGNFPTPVADTSNTNATLAIYAGDNAAANNTLSALYFYRGAAAKGYIGFDSSVAVMNPNKTKGLNDLVLLNDSCVVDNNGRIYTTNTLNATTGLNNTEAVLTSGNMPTGLQIQNAAHTGLNVAATQEVFFSFARTLTFGAGGGTAATMDQILITAPVYSAAAAMTITKPSTVRITGAPSTSAVGGFAPTFSTGPYSLCVDAGVSLFGGGLVVGTAVLANAATAGFLYLPTVAGTPTGVPVTQAGGAANVYDTTANKIWVYNGAWRGVLVA